MTLAALVGNTNTRFTSFDGLSPVGSIVVPTPQWRRGLRGFAGRYQGACVASVVPAVTDELVLTLGSVTGLKPFVVGPTTKTGLSFKYDRRQLGVDRVCAAVGAFLRWRTDLVVTDFGTATTVNVVTGKGVFVGGLILPGVNMMLDALSERTARLPRPATRVLEDPLQLRTVGAMQAGVSLLQAGGMDMIVSRIERNFRRRFKVVATGGGAPYARRLFRRISAIDPLLASRGLIDIHETNRVPAKPLLQTRRRANH